MVGPLGGRGLDKQVVGAGAGGGGGGRLEVGKVVVEGD